jgi:hypothetical protein
MKNTKFFISVLLILFCACNQEEKNLEFSILGYWNLVEITTDRASTDFIMEVPGFEEKYIFNHDGTFIKFSTKINGVGEVPVMPSQALGQFQVSPASGFDENSLFDIVLIFETNMKMAANCGDMAIEHLFITKDYKLINDQRSSCDGPGFIYSKN